MTSNNSNHPLQEVPSPPIANPFYSKPKPKPFASSAQKRMSVQALHSISHLQHSFAKLSFNNRLKEEGGSMREGSSFTEEPEEMDKENEGGENGDMKGIRRRGNRSLRINLLGGGGGGGTSSALELPPSPVAPNPTVRLPWEGLDRKSIILGKKELKEEMVEALSTLCSKWGLIDTSSRRLSRSARFSSSNGSHFRSSTRESSDRPLSSISTVSSSEEMKIGVNSTNFLSDLIESTTKSIRTIQHYSLSLPPTTTATSTVIANPTSSLRQSTFFVLSTLAEIKELYRLPSSSVSSCTNTTNVYDFDEPISGNGEEEEEVEYRNDVGLEDLEKEVEIIREYVELVDRVLFRKGEDKGKKKKLVRASRLAEREGEGEGEGKGEEEEEEEEEEGNELEEGVEEEVEELPIWARREGFLTDLDRIYAILSTHLVEPHLSRLNYPSPLPIAFLESISDGELLCEAYNSVIRNSSRPFGFIPNTSIHLVPSSHSTEAGAGAGKDNVGTTFRKIENLKLFVAAIKFRYLITNGIEFEAKTVARRGIGWEEMLEKMVKKWMEAVVNEKREEIEVVDCREL